MLRHQQLAHTAKSVRDHDNLRRRAAAVLANAATVAHTSGRIDLAELGALNGRADWVGENTVQSLALGHNAGASLSGLVADTASRRARTTLAFAQAGVRGVIAGGNLAREGRPGAALSQRSGAPLGQWVADAASGRTRAALSFAETGVLQVIARSDLAGEGRPGGLGLVVRLAIRCWFEGLERL